MREVDDIVPYADTSFLLFGFSTDTSGSLYNPKIDFSLIDQQLNHLEGFDSFSLEEEAKLASIRLRFDKQGNILIPGALVLFKGFRPFIYKFSYNLDSLYYAVFNKLPGRVYDDIAQLKNGSFWILDGIGARTHKLDSNFNWISEHYLGEPITNPFGIKWDTDTSFYLAGEWNGGSDDDIGILHQPHTFDTTNTIFTPWGKENTLELTAYEALDYKNKDSIYVGGTSPFFLYNNTQSSNWMFLLQLDSTLKIRWEKFIGGDAHYVMSHVLAAKDGSCFVAGTRYDYLNTSEFERDIIIMKIDANGTWVSQEENTKTGIREAIVYPNPGCDEMNVRIARQYAGANVIVYGMDGQKLIEEKISGVQKFVNVSKLKPGSYVYKIFNMEGLFESGVWVKE